MSPSKPFVNRRFGRLTQTPGSLDFKYKHRNIRLLSSASCAYGNCKLQILIDPGKATAVNIYCSWSIGIKQWHRERRNNLNGIPRLRPEITLLDSIDICQFIDITARLIFPNFVLNEIRINTIPFIKCRFDAFMKSRILFISSAPVVKKCVFLNLNKIYFIRSHKPIPRQRKYLGINRYRVLWLHDRVLLLNNRKIFFYFFPKQTYMLAAQTIQRRIEIRSDYHFIDGWIFKRYAHLELSLRTFPRKGKPQAFGACSG